jgi:hypothetical protein
VNSSESSGAQPPAAHKIPEVGIFIYYNGVTADRDFDYQSHSLVVSQGYRADAKLTE